MNKKKLSYIIVMFCVICVLLIKIYINNNVTYSAGTTLVDTVKILNKGSSWSSGASGVYYTNSHEYRYVGANVNNYVIFNDDLYRIIGVFDSNTHGQSSEMVKLIKARTVANCGWGVNNTTNNSGVYSNYNNDWTGKTTGFRASLNILLNEYFYNKTSDSATYGNCSDWTYMNSSTEGKTDDCVELVGYGINSQYRGYISTANWYLYGYSTNELSKQNFYLCERGLYSGCVTGMGNTTDGVATSKIGLMYTSDYMYANGYYSSSDTTTASSYYYANQNWLYFGQEWLMNIISGSDSINGVNVYSHLTRYYGYAGIGVRPTFYLKSDVYVTGGNGSFDNPYTIACDTCG